jgi:hypothetical protein
MKSNNDLKKYCKRDYTAIVEDTIEQAIELRFGKFEWLRVKCSNNNTSVEFLKEGVTEKEIIDFLEQFKKNGKWKIEKNT